MRLEMLAFVVSETHAKETYQSNQKKEKTNLKNGMGTIREEVNMEILQGSSEWGFKAFSAIPTCGFI